ncbi:MAG: hypothetical protein ABIR51_03105, partial [Sphingomicrobium sp.]
MRWRAVNNIGEAAEHTKLKSDYPLGGAAPSKGGVKDFSGGEGYSHREAAPGHNPYRCRQDG